MPDHLDALDPRFPIELGPRCDLFWAALALWQAYPSHAARTFAMDEAAAAVAQATRREETFIRPLDDPPAVTFAPRVYAALDPDTLAHEFAETPLELLP